ncbi:MAG: hypothetical protein MJZ03_03325 [archaeon]|nr:hypothetical protein [archaeon]
MSMKSKILAILSGIGAFFSAIFYVLYQQKKDELKLAENENEQLHKDAEIKDTIIDAQSESKKAGDEQRKKNNEIKNKIHGDNGAESVSAIHSVLCDN